MKSESYEKGIQECGKIKELIEVGKKCEFDEYPSDFGYIDTMIQETEKLKIFDNVLIIVDRYQDSFLKLQKIDSIDVD